MASPITPPPGEEDDILLDALDIAPRTPQTAANVTVSLPKPVGAGKDSSAPILLNAKAPEENNAHSKPEIAKVPERHAEVPSITKEVLSKLTVKKLKALLTENKESTSG